MRRSIHRSASWVSQRTAAGSPQALLHPTTNGLSKRPLPDVMNSLEETVIWLDGDGDDVFHKKLDAFLDLDVGSAREQTWLTQ